MTNEYKKTVRMISTRIKKLDELEESIKPTVMKMAKLNQEIADFKAKLLTQLEDEKLDKVTFGGFNLSISSREIPQCKDFDALWAYVAKTKNFGLVTRKLNTTGFKELFQDNDGNWKKKLPKWADFYIKKDVNMKRVKK